MKPEKTQNLNDCIQFLFFIQKENETYFINDLNIKTTFKNWYLQNKKPCIWLFYDGDKFKCKILKKFNMYFFDVYQDKTMLLSLEAKRFLNMSFKDCLKEIEKRIKRGLNEFYKQF